MECMPGEWKDVNGSGRLTLRARPAAPIHPISGRPASPDRAGGRVLPARRCAMSVPGGRVFRSTRGCDHHQPRAEETRRCRPIPEPAPLRRPRTSSTSRSSSGPTTTGIPDPSNPLQAVAFGTSGHRGSSLNTIFNDDHIAATTQAIVEYRTREGTDGPLFVGADTHALSGPAWETCVEVLAANDVAVLVDAAGGFTPTPAVSHAILAHNRSRAAGLADGVVITPVAQPAAGRRLQVQPAERRARRHRRHQVDRRTGRTSCSPRSWTGCGAGRWTRCAASSGAYDFLGGYVDDLPVGGEHGRDPGRGRADRGRPDGRRQRRVLGRDRRAARPRPHRRQPERRPAVRVHDAGLGRQDPHGLLVAVRDGLAGRSGATSTRSPPATTPTPTGTASSPPTPADEPQPLPGRGHRLPVREPPGLAGGHRDRQDGRQLVDDRLRRRTTWAGGWWRPPSGSSGSCRACIDGSIAFGGEESAGASFLRTDGTVWTTDKDGIILCLLASEILAVTGQTPASATGS